VELLLVALEPLATQKEDCDVEISPDLSSRFHGCIRGNSSDVDGYSPVGKFAVYSAQCLSLGSLSKIKTFPQRKQFSCICESFAAITISIAMFYSL
jgi:hypothetical protein